jgi:hypothetical protein
MKIKELLNNEICYFRFGLEDLPFKKAKLNFEYKYGYCRVCPVFKPDGISPPFLLITGIYNFFTNDRISDTNEFRKQEFFIGQKLCFYPRLRGQQKLDFIGSEEWHPIDLPHLTNSAASLKADEEIISYFTDGYYTVTIGRETPKMQSKFLKHLEDNIIVTHEELKIYIFLEVLKMQKPNLSTDELHQYSDLLYGFYCTELNHLGPLSLNQIVNLVNQRYKKPIFLSLPISVRERAITSVPF